MDIVYEHKYPIKLLSWDIVATPQNCGEEPELSDEEWARVDMRNFVLNELGAEIPIRLSVGMKAT